MDALKLNSDVDFNQLLEAVKQLSPMELLTLNDAIWNEAIEIPAEHQALVLNRVAKSEIDSSRILDWEKVSKNL
jgi:hypothetical protein